MSILFFEGFDFYGSNLNTDLERSILVRRELWRQTRDLQDLILFESRGGGNAISLESTNTSNEITEPTDLYLSTQNFQATDNICVGLAFKYTGDVDMGQNIAGTVRYGFPLFQIGGADYDRIHIYQLDLYRNSFSADVDADLYFRDWGYNIHAGPFGNLAQDIWHYVECQIDRTAAPTVAVKIWVNGGLFVDTTFTEIAGVRAIPFETFRLIGRKAAGYACDPVYVDDIYALDLTDASDGPTFQQRLGPISIRPMPATADSASLNEWTPLGGGSRYVEIDEQPGPNDLDATYILTDAAPRRQLFQVSTPHDLGTQIIAVASFAVIKQPDPVLGVAKLGWQARANSVDVTSIWSEPLQSVYRMASEYYVQMPDGAGFSPAAIQAGEWGVRSEVGS